MTAKIEVTKNKMMRAEETVLNAAIEKERGMSYRTAMMRESGSGQQGIIEHHEMCFPYLAELP